MTKMQPIITVKGGTTFRIATDEPFTAIDGTIVDPDVVWFGYIVNGGDPVSYSYTRGAANPDPTNHIIRTGTGSYYMDVDTTSLEDGVLEYSILGEPGTSGLDTTRTKVRVNGQIVIDQPPFTLG